MSQSSRLSFWKYDHRLSHQRWTIGDVVHVGMCSQLPVAHAKQQRWSQRVVELWKLDSLWILEDVSTSHLRSWEAQVLTFVEHQVWQCCWFTLLFTVNRIYSVFFSHRVTVTQLKDSWFFTVVYSRPQVAPTTLNDNLFLTTSSRLNE